MLLPRRTSEWVLRYVIHILWPDGVVIRLRGTFVKQVNFAHFGDDRHNICSISNHHCILFKSIQLALVLIIILLITHHLHHNLRVLWLWGGWLPRCRIKLARTLMRVLACALLVGELASAGLARRVEYFVSILIKLGHSNIVSFIIASCPEVASRVKFILHQWRSLFVSDRAHCRQILRVCAGNWRKWRWRMVWAILLIIDYHVLELLSKNTREKKATKLKKCNKIE